MQKSKNCDYYIGLDMGDASVGWAVTDTNYNILKFNGKALWGIRLFDSANTAASTRVFVPADAELTEQHGVLRCYRNYLRRKSLRLIPVSLCD